MRKHKNNKPTLPPRAVLFARVSSREQERGDSIEGQLQTVNDYCQKNNIPVLKEEKITESSFRGERKKFYEMLDFVKKQNGKIIIIANTIDRIQRRFHEYIELDILRLADKIEIHFIRENLKISKKSNSFEIGAWTQGVLWAQQYVMQSGDNVKRAYEASCKKGRWLHRAPLGYQNYRDETEAKHIRIDPVKGPIVKYLFEEYATGNYSLQKLADLANSMGLKTDFFKTKANKKLLDKKNIDNMLHNPFYYGIMRNKDGIYPHIHGNLITKELWDKVQEIASGKYRPGLRVQKHTFAFSGIIHCATCGYAMTPERHTKKSGKEYVYLKCSHKPHIKCNQPMVNEQIVFEQLEADVFQKLYADPRTLKDIKQKVRKAIEKEHEEALMLKKQTEQQLAEIDFMKGRYTQLLAKGTITEEMYKQQMNEVVEKEAELKDLLKSRSIIDSEIVEMVDCVADFAGNSGLYFNSSNISEKQQFLRIVSSNSTIEDKKLRFSLLAPFSELSEKPSSVIWWGLPDSNQRPDRYERPALTN